MNNLSNKSTLFLFLLLVGFLSSCETEKDTPNPSESTAKVRFEFRFDPNQERLDNLAQPIGIATGNAAQTPIFNAMSVHYIEFAPSATTQLGEGQILYKNEEVSSSKNGFTTAIDFSKAIISPEGEVFLDVPIKDIAAGKYEWVRASVAYQNLSINYDLNNIQVGNDNINLPNQEGTIAGFIGYNTRINDFTVKDKTISINDDKKQGFWAFETMISLPQYGYTSTDVSQGQSAGTTVVNPLAATSPVPAGSCVITGSFDNALTITGKETEDITVVLSFSIKDSFEWKDTNSNGKWDINVGNQVTEQVVDMGLRGLQVKVK
ncbi:hypothetical protein WAF17_05360 [Bernardetia sp. ABR2-2B]|uniref:hypothetical protein n=1 Tax=Bernardetia sp. ABR2-2B TaxID=3127472 RepID=UPI0030D3AEF3